MKHYFVCKKTWEQSIHLTLVKQMFVMGGITIFSCKANTKCSTSSKKRRSAHIDEAVTFCYWHMHDGWPSHAKQENTSIKTCRMYVRDLQESPRGNQWSTLFRNAATSTIFMTQRTILCGKADTNNRIKNYSKQPDFECQQVLGVM